MLGTRTHDTKRLPSLDGLRGIAAIAVMLFHFDIAFLPRAQMLAFMPFHGRAYLGVDLFFMLSGFVMAHVYGSSLASNWREHWKSFAITRFARIYPLFALSTLAVVVTVAISDTKSMDAPGHVSFSGLLLTLQPFLLQQWASSLNWNYPSWSISTEAEVYVLFVFLAGPLVTGKYPRSMAACCIVALTALSVAGGGRLDFPYGIQALTRTFAEFSLGVLLYRACLGDIRLARGWAGIIAILCMGSGLLARQDLLVVIGLACLIYHSVGATDAVGRLLNLRPSIALGNWSYSIYLWHVPAYFAISAAFAAKGYPVNELSSSNAKLLLAATATAVIGLSAVSYHYFETPMRRLIVRGLTAGGRSNPARRSERRSPPCLTAVRSKDCTGDRGLCGARAASPKRSASPPVYPR